MTYMLQLEGEGYNYKNKTRIIYNQEYLGYKILLGILLYSCVIYFY